MGYNVDMLCMCVCIVYIHLCVCIHVCICHTYICICICVCIHVCIYIYAYAYHIYIYIYIYIYTYTHTHIYIYIYIYIFFFSYVCVCVMVSNHFSRSLTIECNVLRGVAQAEHGHTMAEFNPSPKHISAQSWVSGFVCEHLSHHIWVPWSPVPFDIFFPVSLVDLSKPIRVLDWVDKPWCSLDHNFKKQNLKENIDLQCRRGTRIGGNDSYQPPGPS